jgi:hypothetical protein
MEEIFKLFLIPLRQRLLQFQQFSLYKFQPVDDGDGFGDLAVGVNAILAPSKCSLFLLRDDKSSVDF